MLVHQELEDLAKRASSGDRVALDQLLRAIQPTVLRLCGRYLPCLQDAEEACQDVLLKIAERLPQFEWRSKFSTWLHTVVNNSAMDTYRSLKRRAARIGVDDQLAARPDPRTTSVIAGSRVDLLDALERLEADRPKLAATFVLRDISQLSYAEIAEQLDIPEGTVKARVHSARQVVRELLDTTRHT
ncbi:RNA polymerase sigma factor [Kibdelosporangium phytohabitans]|uniref:RNA polymerase subunit sigma-24 n=1 Tax=Kibdelosporangium phytohabitans TaxID=860235 RepID=A0A0N9I045_9PSEU|nr:RNA polymerase sigma factor [Kibdelosporangium phytohabitans]ALG08008.1 RNA polymerase subunit sigma-24 [Kibdelosporangium phytohabitans]MBE1471034.1 RNA polymerase sigma-70 factor (ECF subfamily) [Kibdelosporangium phytohabitans]